MMLVVVLLVILALATGLLGFLIKGAFWLFIFAVVFFAGAYYARNRSRT